MAAGQREGAEGGKEVSRGDGGGDDGKCGSCFGGGGGCSRWVREEWWWPWDELPRSLRLAAVNLGYDRMSWQTEEFAQCGQRFLDMEELMFEMENPGGSMWRDDVDGVQSDSELISPGLGRCLDGRVVTADSHRTMTYPSWYVERTGVGFSSHPMGWMIRDENEINFEKSLF